MAVLGNRATGLLDMITEGLRRSGQDMQQPNMSPVSRTPLQQAMDRPQAQLSAEGNILATSMPNDPYGMPVEQSTVPLIQDLARGRIVNVNDPLRPMSEPMPAQQAVANEQGRQEALKKAQDAAKVKKAMDEDPSLEQDPTFMDQVKGYFGNRENMVKLALAFNSMRLTPDQGLASVLGAELKDIRATSADESLRNKTAAYFDKVDPKIANAIRAGLSAKDAIALYREKEKGVVVGKMVINPTTGAVIYDGTDEGSELPSTYRALQLRAEAAGLRPGTPEYSQFMINGGQKAGLSIKTYPDGTFEITEGGAAGAGKPQTEGQSKALAFGTRMSTSQETINLFENEGTSIRNWISERVPVGGNFLSTPEYKEYAQAKRDFVNALLRWESGAAIGPAEFASADLQYFPQPGDTQAVIDQKRANRDVMIRVMQNVAGAGNEEKARDYAQQIKVEIFGQRAANWPDAGTIIDDPDNPGTKIKFKGGDPDIDSNWVEVK